MNASGQRHLFERVFCLKYVRPAFMRQFSNISIDVFNMCGSVILGEIMTCLDVLLCVGASMCKMGGAHIGMWYFKELSKLHAYGLNFYCFRYF